MHTHTPERSGPLATLNPFWMLAKDAHVAPCHDLAAERRLAGAPMRASAEQTRVAVPLGVLAKLMLRSSTWPAWNPLFKSVKTTAANFTACNPLEGTFHVLPNLDVGDASLRAPTIVRRSVSNASVYLSWTYAFRSAASGEVVIYGRHDYALVPSCENADDTWLWSWEAAVGEPVDATLSAQRVEEHTLRFATLAAIEGIECVARVYAATGALNIADVASACDGGVDGARALWRQMHDGGYYAP